MAIIGLNINQVSAVLNAILKQANIGPSAVVDSSSFVSVAQSALKIGYDPILNSIGQVLSKTIMSTRPYSRKFKGLEVDSLKWGNIVRKINYVDSAITEDNRYKIENDESIDMYKVVKPVVLQTNFYGQIAFQKSYTLFKDNLDVAFSSPAEFSAWVTGLVQNNNDVVEQAHEGLARSCLVNLIGGTILGNTKSVINLLKEYNTQNGTTLKKADVMKSQNFPDFMKFVVATIKIYAKLMSERSKMFQINVTGKEISRHTPAKDLKMYLYTPIMEHVKTQVLSDIFNDEYMKMVDYEEVNYWQTISDTDIINATVSYMRTDGMLVSGEVNNSSVLGVMFDSNACGYTNINNWSAPTPFNSSGGYTNVHMHFNDRYYNDFTEKVIVLTIEDYTT